jgi:F0F1-type ATP synthase epsilon subunit
MHHEKKELTVELSTPGGRVFSGVAASVDLCTDGGNVYITPSEDCYLVMVHATQVTLQLGKKTHSFALHNAVASLRMGLLTILAEEIQPLPGELAPLTLITKVADS